MFSIFKKKTEVITAHISGKVVPVEKVNDEVFSAKILGEGIGICPTEDMIVAPCDGEVVSVMEDTKHAIVIKTYNGIEILIHIGINTVSMKGDWFELFTKTGDSVKKGDKLISFNSELIKSNGLIAFYDNFVTA